MKNFIFAILLFTVFILSNNVQAYDPFYPGSFSNPLQVQISPDPTQWYEQTLRDQQMKMYQENQERYQQQMLQQQRDLQTQLLQQRLDARLPSHNGASTSQPSCQSGYLQKKVANSYACVTYNTWCDIEYSNSVFQKFQANGKDFICDCKTGYMWNDQKTSCIVTTTVSIKTNEVTLPPGCDSTLNYSSITGISCDGKNRCSAGSQLNSIFNTNETRCVPISKTTTPVIKKVAQVKAIQNEVKENDTSITKLDSINLNQEVTTSTIEVKPKGFWTKLKGWLGF